MQHHLSDGLGRAPLGGCGSSASLLAGGRSSRSRASWLRASCPAAIERRTSRESVDPNVSSSCAPFATAVSRSRASARSSSPVSWLVPPKETCWWSMLKCRPSAALPGVLGGFVGHEPGDRLGDEPLQRCDADAVRERCHLGVHERGRFLGQQHRRLRDATGPPRLEVAGLHPCPDSREAVLQLHRCCDLCSSAVGGAADREGELGDAELRDQWCAFSGEGEAGVAAGGDPGGCLVDGLRWVLLGPGHRGDHQHGVCVHRCGPGLACHPQHISRGVEVLEIDAGGCCHE